MGGGSGLTDDALRERAHQLIELNRLPRIKPVRIWASLGAGAACSLCEAPILSSEPEFELQFVPQGMLRLHRRCYAAWEAMRQAPVVSQWTPVAQALPPLGAVVEARLDLGGARCIILSLVCVEATRLGLDDAPASPAMWLNATTHGPLPDGWRPVEWRYPPGAAPYDVAQQDDVTLPRSA